MILHHCQKVYNTRLPNVWSPTVDCRSCYGVCVCVCACVRMMSSIVINGRRTTCNIGNEVIYLERHELTPKMTISYSSHDFTKAISCHIKVGFASGRTKSGFIFGKSYWGHTYSNSITIDMDPTAILLMVYVNQKMWMKKFEWDLRFKPFPLELKLRSAICIRANRLDTSSFPQSLQHYVTSID